MTVKFSQQIPVVLLIWLCSVNLHAELLQHLSEDNEPTNSTPTLQSNSSSGKTSKIIYRVTCSAEDQSNDCAQTFEEEISFKQDANYENQTQTVDQPILANPPRPSPEIQKTVANYSNHVVKHHHQHKSASKLRHSTTKHK